MRQFEEMVETLRVMLGLLRAIEGRLGRIEQTMTAGGMLAAAQARDRSTSLRGIGSGASDALQGLDREPGKWR